MCAEVYSATDAGNTRGRKVRKKRRSLSRSQTVLLFALVAVGALVIMGAIYWVGEQMEAIPYEEHRGVESENFFHLATVNYKDTTYVKRPEVDTILLMGVDREEDFEPEGYRNGGQADFLLLLVVDHANRTIRQLQIDRDTMASVAIVGVLGNVTSYRDLQICLAHAYGKTEEDRCVHTMDAVNRLLEGANVEKYLCVRLDGIGTLNTALGGVKVTMPVDLSSRDAAMKKGATLTLTNEQAEILVRSRKNVDDGTNQSRMARQRVYMSAVLDAIRTQMDADPNFAEEFFEALDETAANTNVSRVELVNEMASGYQYDVQPVETLPGEHRIGDRDWMEFYADEQAAVNWVIDALYEPRNN